MRARPDRDSARLEQFRAPTHFVLVFDPGTGQLLDSEQVFTTTAGKLHVTVPCVAAYTVYLRAGRSDSLSLPG
jgi:hypothetical protein